LSLLRLISHILAGRVGTGTLTIPEPGLAVVRTLLLGFESVVRGRRPR